jgi:hypothetical protein
MGKNLKTSPSNTESFCRNEIDRMLKYSQTKVIMPVVTLGLLRVFKETGRRTFSDTEVRKAYEASVRMLKEFLGHDVHIGAKYYDAYGLRMSRYSVLESVGHLKYKLNPPYTTFAASLCADYQVKKLRIHTESEADRLYAELKLNFDNERLQDGSVILVIDDISKDVKKYLIDMRVQSISKEELLKMVANFDEPEDRQKVLRIVYEEFRREYSSSIK